MHHTFQAMKLLMSPADPSFPARADGSGSPFPALPLPGPSQQSGLTLLHRGVGVGQEAEVPLVIPADQGHVPLHLDLVLAPDWRGGRVAQHGWWESCAVTLPRAEQTTAVDAWRERRRVTRTPDPTSAGRRDCGDRFGCLTSGTLGGSLLRFRGLSPCFFF
jgi:hypothetical protein